MKSKRKKVLSFFPKPVPIEDRTQEEILEERKKVRKKKLNKFFKKD